MKRYYIINESSWEAPVQFARTKGKLWESFSGSGCTWLDLASGNRIVSGDFSYEDRENAWNSHPAVTHLHHPVKEKTLPLSDLLNAPHAYKRFTSTHMELLKNAVGATYSDTMETLNFKVAAVHPGCTIYDIPKKTTLWIY